MGGGRVRGAKGGKINRNTESRERRFHYFNTLPPAGRPEKVTTRQLLYPPKTEQNFATTDRRHAHQLLLLCLSHNQICFFFSSLFWRPEPVGLQETRRRRAVLRFTQSMLVGGSRSRHGAAAPQARLSPCQEKRLCFQNITSRRFVIRGICRCSDSGVLQQKPKCNNKSLCVFFFCCCYQIFHSLDFIDAVIYILLRTPPRLFCVCVTRLLSDPGGVRRASRRWLSLEGRRVCTFTTHVVTLRKLDCQPLCAEHFLLQ